MQSQSFKSVWEALCDDPEEQQRMIRLSNLMSEIKGLIKKADLTPAAVGQVCDLDEKLVMQFFRDEFSRCSEQTLVSISMKLKAHLIIRPAG